MYSQWFMECVHYDQISYLNHISEHQDESKEFSDDLVEEANAAYIPLSRLQVNNARDELQSNLSLWRRRMLNKIERIHKTLLDDVEEIFVKVKRLSTKSDLYPHELNALRSSLDEMYIRICDTRPSLIDIDYENGNTYLLENENPFESPKIMIL